MSSLVNRLRANIKHKVKIHPLYSLDVAYKKALDYEKFLPVVPRRAPFNLDTRLSLPNTFSRSHPSTQLVDTTSPSSSSPSISSTSLAKTTTPASSSVHTFTSQIECHYYHAKSHIASCCP